MLSGLSPLRSIPTTTIVRTISSIQANQEDKENEGVVVKGYPLAWILGYVYGVVLFTLLAKLPYLFSERNLFGNAICR